MIQSDSIYSPFIFSNILTGLMLALVFCPAGIWFAQRAGLMDLPGALPHKTHSRPVPLAGGLALVLTLLVGGLVINFSMVMELWRILVPALIVFGVGIWDDFKRLPAGAKLTGQILAAVVLILGGTYVRILPHGFLGLPGDWNNAGNILITLFWVIGITNAFNFIDSMDGIVVGTGGVAVAFFVLVTINSPQVSLLRLLTLLVGACVGLFFYNMTPARLFMGDAGAQTLGFLLAAIGIIYNPVSFPQASSWFLPILILGVPIFDTCLVVFSRLRHRTPVYQAGHNHTYHRLTRLGLDSVRAVTVMHIVSIILGCLAFIALNLTPVYANLLFGLVCLAGMLALLYLERSTG
jgi:UDP-GlcNAc:undecaprenyl-phosphate GlcNAc-1-phosphate transferase